MQGRNAIFKTPKCLKNSARRGHAPRRGELKKTRMDFFSNLLESTEMLGACHGGRFGSTGERVPKFFSGTRRAGGDTLPVVFRRFQ
jgi:hypothetical protein